MVGARPSGWLFSPSLDLAFVSVLWWVLPAGLFWFLGDQTTFTIKLTIVNLLLLNLPHRWLTLVLVFGDRERFSTRPNTFVGWLIGIAVFTGAVLALTGTLGVITLVVLVMTKWHFAAQHHGILRIYANLAGRKQTEDEIATEKWLLRSVLLYVLFRVVVQGTENPTILLLEPVVWCADFVALGALGLLAVRELRFGFERRALGRLTYLGSVLGLYGSIVIACNLGMDALAAGLIFAVPMFHAVEYLAICSWTVQKKRSPSGVWAWIAPRAGLSVFAFVVLMFLINVLGPSIDWTPWLFVNIVGTLTHFAYDGIIWKRPAKAAG